MVATYSPMPEFHPIRLSYLDLEREYGTDQLRRAMEYVGTLPNDDTATPIDRLNKVTAWLKGYRGGTLEESLAEVEQQLAGDCGTHRDMLTRVRDRLKTALGKPTAPDYADDHYTGPRGTEAADELRHSQAEAMRLKR